MYFRRSKQQQYSARRKPVAKPLRFELLETRRMLSVIGLTPVEHFFESAVLVAPGRWDIGDKLKLTMTPETLSDNVNAADTVNADQLRTGGGLGLDLDGSGVTVGIWDSGRVRDTHDEFQIAGGGSRVTIVDTGAALSDHSTHVAGTIGAQGSDAAARGMASNVMIRSRDSVNDSAELAADAAGIDLSNHSYSHSRGWQLPLFTVTINNVFYPVDTWVGDRDQFAVENAIFGKYEDTQNPIDAALGQSPLLPSEIDQIAFDNPTLLSVWSAGNDRNDVFTNALRTATEEVQGLPNYDQFYVAFDGTLGQFVFIDGTVQNNEPPPGDGNGGTGYDSLPQSKVAKNNLVVGAIEDITDDPYTTNDVVMTAYSSWGPTDDGRIKPDVVANGDALYSSEAASDTDYGSKNGTSMAAPNVTGTAALLVEHYRNLFGDGNPSTNSYPNLFDDDNPRSATTKGLLIHTAFDAGNVGPDYQNGWGVVDAAAAANFLTEAEQASSTDYLFERAYDGSGWQLNVNSDGTEPLRVTIVWTDPAPLTANLPGSGLDDSTSVLVNDLDLTVSTVVGYNIFRPWNLDPANPSAAATRPVEIINPNPDYRNHRDNVEQVLIDAPTAGDYIISIGRTGSTFNQDYSLLVSGATLVPPTVTSKFPFASATVYSTSIDVDVTFSEEVRDVGSSDLVISGVGGAGASVGTPFETGQTNRWRFPVNGLVAGAVDLSLAPNAGDITNTAYVDLANVTWSYTASAPTGPVNLTLTQLSGTEVRIDWADATGEDGYDVWQYSPPNHIELATLNPGATTYTVTGLGSGVHNFSIDTFNTIGSLWSDNSNWKPITMVVPTSPTNLTLTAVSGSQVDLTWNDADMEDGYYVWQFAYPNILLATLNPGATSFSVTGLSRGVNYNFSVSAFNTVGENFNASPSGWQAIIIEPTRPENLSLTVVSSTQIDLSWSDADLEEGYKIYQWASPTILLDTISADETSYSVTGLSPSTGYFFSISAYDSVVEKFNTNPSGWQAATTALLLGEAARLVEVDDPTTVSDEELAPLIDEAIRRWAETGVDPRVVARLEQTEVRIEALAPDFLGLAYSDSGVIILDDDASGRGWYIDATPADDAEFTAPSLHGEMIALAGGPAADAVDLLTAVMHEMGHVLGFGHEGGHYAMSETLASGVRRLPHFDEPVAIYDLAEERGPGGFVHRLPEPVPALDGSGRSIVAYRLESEDDLLWAIYRRDVGERLGFSDPAAALDQVMADWGQGN